ncbi:MULTISPECIES: extracellular solute-binding protein [Facklamia]|uniref:extracellular solute-binding protein n=1 Tax=Facklamia sp. HMSC062C11 TaxID=1739262 RepID=UPI0008A1FD92|nr:extracellular solute-binding protein [Facklamia sp. HMSC062C11]OFL65560.1 hypothetical protein HMPREF2758_01675 [Facklamia sp. HMSC062C11]
MKKKLLSIVLSILALISVPITTIKVYASETVKEITFWHTMSGDYTQLLEKQVNQFNETIGKENGIKVIPVQQEWPNTEKLMTAMSANDLENMPDVIQLSAEGVPVIRDYANAVYAEDLFEKDHSILNKEDILDSARAAYSINDRLFGVPYAISALLMYVNKDALSEVGIDQSPKTLEDLAIATEALSKSESVENALNIQIDLYKLENLVTTQGQGGIPFGSNNNGHDGPFDKFLAGENGDLLKFLEKWEQVARSKSIKPIAEAENEEFALGVNAITIMSSSRIQIVNELVDDSFEWEVTAIPTVSSEDIGGANASGSGLYILDREKDNIDAAWLFVQYMASAENQVSWLDGTGYVPINKQVTELDDYKQYIENNPKLEVPFNILLNTPEVVIPSYIPNFADVGTVIKETMEKLSLGELTAGEANDKISSEVQTILDEFYENQ